MPTDCLTISYNGPRTALPSLMAPPPPPPPPEYVQTAARNPVRAPNTNKQNKTKRALVAEQFAPAATARGTVALAVADGTRAGDDADSIAAEQRARPAANHVVAAGIPAGRQASFWKPAQCLDQGAILAIGGQPKKAKSRSATRSAALANTLPTASASKVPRASSPMVR